MLPNQVELYANNMKRIMLTCSRWLNDKTNCKPRESVATYECEKGYNFENAKSK
jgi:hypothetical protein